MSDETLDPRFGDMAPCLIPGARFIDFSPTIDYLNDPDSHAYLKLKKEDSKLIRMFTGKQTLAEILHDQLETTGTTQFQRILSLLLLLYQHGFLVSGNVTLREMSFCIVQEKNAVSRLGRLLKSVIAFDLLKIQRPFASPVLQRCARAISSLPGLGALFFITVANNILPADHGGINFSDILSGATTTDPIGMGAYFLSLATVWFGTCAILSLKSLLTAFVLSSKSCAVLQPRIRFFAGLVYFDCDPADIVSAGRDEVLHLYGVRILLPFALLTAVSVLSALGITLSAVTLFKEACVLVAVFAILPLANTDMNKALGILSGSTNDFVQNLTFLRRRYVSHVLSFKHKAVQGLGISHIMVISTFLWLLIAYVLFHFQLMERFNYILDNVGPGISWNVLLIITQLFIIITPFLVLVGMALFIALSNVQVIFRFPARRLMGLAESIARQDVPAENEVVSFLREIPLFVHLETENLKRLCTYMKLVRFGSQHTIILQGERGDAFYIIVSGMVAIEVEDEYGQTQIVDTLAAGHGFGEIALIENVPRTATVRSVTPVSLFVLDRKHFANFVNDWTGGKERLTDIIRTSKLLMSSPLFAHLPPTQMRTLIARFETHLCAPGTVVFNQDDPGDRMFLIRDGKIEIRHIESGKPVFTKSLVTGDWLGEIALVKSLPRTASAVAVEKSVLLSLSRSDFYSIMQHSLLTGIEFNKLADKRLEELRTKTIRS